MKSTVIFTTLALALAVSAAPRGNNNNNNNNRFGGNNNRFGGNNNNKNQNQNQNQVKQVGSNGGVKVNQDNASSAAAAAATTAAAAATTAAAAAASSAAAASGANNAASSTSASDDSDPQDSTTLDPRVIATGFANNGQAVPDAGQVASLTSDNNFINFCLTVPNLPITNGKQITTGSCNPAPIGVIPTVDNMPSAKFVDPPNGGSVTANTAFNISMAVQNLVTGNFVNAQENYFAAPQQLDQGSGNIIGHTHFVVELLQDGLGQTTPTSPGNFAFFKGVNGAAVNGVVSEPVADGLPAGAYRVCSINSAANHQPVIVPVAQHGALDDCAYFTAK